MSVSRVGVTRSSGVVQRTPFFVGFFCDTAVSHHCGRVVETSVIAQRTPFFFLSFFFCGDPAVCHQGGRDVTFGDSASDTIYFFSPVTYTHTHIHFVILRKKYPHPHFSNLVNYTHSSFSTRSTEVKHIETKT